MSWAVFFAGVAGSERELMTGGSNARVLFLNRSYWPDMEATGQLLTTLCEGLSDDFQVQVIAGQPNSIDPQAKAAGWKNLHARHDVEIRRLSHLQLPKRKIWMKAMNYVSFAISVRKALRRLSAPDVVVFETDPFILAFEANRLQKRTGCKMVGYLQDIHPDVGIALGKISNSLWVRRLRERLFAVYRRCDRMVVLSRDMKRLLEAGGVSGHKIDIIPNWADTNAVQPVPEPNPFRQKHGLQGKFLVMYSGNLGLTQRLEEFVEAAEKLADRQDIRFVFIGKGALELQLKNQVQSRGLQNVSFFDYQPKDQLGDSLSAADLHLIPLTASLAQCLMPSKLYGILAAGRPCLTNAPADSELHQIVSQQQVGLTVPPGSVPAIAERIHWAANHREELTEMGRRARQYAEGNCTPQISIELFRQTLHRVTSPVPHEPRPSGSDHRQFRTL
jgi:glycosyltransferase involved in cell wall biosynthesis